MKSGLLALVCCIGSLVSLLLYFESPSPEGLEILPATTVALDAVRQGTTTNVEFYLNNTSPRSIAIVNVGTSCGCIDAELADKQLDPGEQVKLDIAYSSGTRRGNIEGRVIIVYLMTDEEHTRSKMIHIVGRIDPDYLIMPEKITFPSGVESTQFVELIPHHLDSVAVTNVVCDKKFYSARLISTDSDRNQTIEVTYHPARFYANAGEGHLLVDTDSETQPVARVPLAVALAGDN